MFLGFGVSIPFAFAPIMIVFVAFAVTIMLVVGIEQVLEAE